MSDRGLHRAVYASLLDDPGYQALSSEARLVLLTARLCPQNTIASIFRYYPETLSAQTGLARKDLERALAELQAAKWIVCDAHVLWIRNGLRFDPTVRLEKDEKHRKGVERAVAGLPRSAVVSQFCEYYALQCPFLSSELTEEAPSEGLRTGSGEPVYRNRNRSRNRRSFSESERVSFDRFWTLYPRHRNKGDAEKAWLTLEPDEDLCAIIEAAVQRWRGSLEWQSAPRFIPYPATWLRAKGWEDEPNPVARTTPQTAENVRSLAGWVQGANT